MSLLREIGLFLGDDSISIERLIQLEKTLLEMAASAPDDLIWKQKWIEGAQATRQEIEFLKKEGI